MKIIAIALKHFILLKSVLALSIIPQETEFRRSQQVPALVKVIDVLSKIDDHVKYDRRTNQKPYAVGDALFETFKRDLKRYGNKQGTRVILRDDEIITTEKPLTGEEATQAHQDEKELRSIANKKHSALLDRPFVESRGKNDFLVMKNENDDPFVTVAPNNIYYGIEKKCVNWLDSCSLQGIRAHLLKKVNSPYK